MALREGEKAKRPIFLFLAEPGEQAHAAALAAERLFGQPSLAFWEACGSRLLWSRIRHSAVRWQDVRLTALLLLRWMKLSHGSAVYREVVACF